MDGAVVLEQAFLRRLVVVRRDDEGGIGASLLCVARQQDRFLGRVGAGSGDHRNTAFGRSEEHTSELQSLMRISYAVFCLIKKNYYHILISLHGLYKHHS